MIGFAVSFNQLNRKSHDDRLNSHDLIMGAAMRSSAEQELVSSGNWPDGESGFLHSGTPCSPFSMEEDRLFPFEQHMGHTMGPTQVMRMSTFR